MHIHPRTYIRKHTSQQLLCAGEYSLMACHECNEQWLCDALYDSAHYSIDADDGCVSPDGFLLPRPFYFPLHDIWDIL